MRREFDLKRPIRALAEAIAMNCTRWPEQNVAGGKGIGRVSMGLFELAAEDDADAA